MKLILSIVIFLLSVTSLTAQKNGISFYYSTDRAYRTYVGGMGYLGSTWGANQQFKCGYTFGVNYERTLTNKLTLISGLSFSNKGYQSKKGSLRFSDQILPKNGFVLPVSDTKYLDFRYRYNYFIIGLPVGVNYHIPFRNIKFFFGGGVSVNYLVNTSVKVIYYADGEKNKVTKRDDPREYYKKFNLSAFVNIGIEGNLKNGYSYRVFPNASYTLTNIMNDKIIYRIYPYSIGLGLGVVKTF